MPWYLVLWSVLKIPEILYLQMIASWNQMAVACESRDGRMPTSTQLVNVQMVMHTSLAPHSVVGQRCTTVSIAHTKKGRLLFSIGSR